MSNEILINVRPSEVRVAYLENGNLLDLKIEKKTSLTKVGSVHKGKVIRVLPGMQAAFVDIGLDKAAFLYVGDVKYEKISKVKNIVEKEIYLEETADNESPILIDNPKNVREIKEKRQIQTVLKEGQHILVQIAKAPIGSKGARITMHISLPGRYVVYMPTLEHLGISRKIDDEKERERLKNLVEKLKPNGGLIVRTAGEGASESSIKEDLAYLQRLWIEINKTYEKRKTSGIMHAELDIGLKAVRDLLSDEVSNVYIDDESTYKKIQKFITQFMPKFKNNIIYYQEHQPLFDLYGIDLEISRSLDRRVWLRSGGYIVIDEAEALVVIDVNTGKFVGKKDFEDTILKTNLEAAKEIAHQLRIRNCGGIIIIDFIDMEKESHQEQVLKLLSEELQKDFAKTNVVSMSSLGLVEMTRKRIKPSLVKTLCESCFYCDGKGYIKSKSTIANEIFRELERDFFLSGNKNKVPIVHCHSNVVDWIYEEANESIEKLENSIGSSVSFVKEPGYHLEQYEIFLI